MITSCWTHSNRAVHAEHRRIIAHNWLQVSLLEFLSVWRGRQPAEPDAGGKTFHLWRNLQTCDTAWRFERNPSAQVVYTSFWIITIQGKYFVGGKKHNKLSTAIWWAVWNKIPNKEFIVSSNQNGARRLSREECRDASSKQKKESILSMSCDLQVWNAPRLFLQHT